MGKTRKSRKEKYSHRDDPLDKQILENRFAQASSRNKIRSKPSAPDEYVDEKLTSEILKAARQQQEDLEEEIGLPFSDTIPSSHLGSSDASDNEVEISDANSNVDKEEENEIANVDEDDVKALELCTDSEKKATLADNLKDKLTEKRTEVQTMYSETGSVFAMHIEEKIVTQFEKLAPVLKEYRSGKLPKAFKAIPRSIYWEKLLEFTKPDEWSAATMFHATKMFSSNLADNMAQRFYNKFLLPRLRDDIHESKALNKYLYQAVKKALFKPAAFFKGIIIPICNAKDATQREATIIGSIVAKCSIPVLHSSAALLMIAEMEYSPINCIFMRILIEKKYALPYRVINGVVNYFLRFKDFKEQLTLLWHQCLLTFAQSYKVDITEKQKTELLKLITIHTHEKVTPEIRKELQEEPDVMHMMNQLWKI